MTKRYYRVRELDRIEHRELSGMPFALTSFEHAGVRHRAASVFAEPGELSDVLHALRDLRAGALRWRACCWPTCTPGARTIEKCPATRAVRAPEGAP